MNSIRHILTINGIEMALILKETNSTEHERNWDLEKIINKQFFNWDSGCSAFIVSIRRYDHENNLLDEKSFFDCHILINNREWVETTCESHHRFAIKFAKRN